MCEATMDTLKSTLSSAVEYLTDLLAGDEEKEEDSETEVKNGGPEEKTPEEREEKTTMDEREDDAPFDPDYMSDLFKSCLQKDDTVNAYEFVLACKQVPKLMGGMGKTFKLGNSKLWEKINWMERRLGEAADDLGKDVKKVTLQDMIERDIANGWTHTGKPTNHATRNIIRMVWFVDFIQALFVAVGNETSNGSLRKLILEVYKTSLGQHHPFAIRSVTATGIKVSPIPNRKEFAKHVGFADLSLEDQNVKLLEWAQTTEALSAVMWAYLKEKKLEKVP